MSDFAFTRPGVVAPEASTSWYEGAGILESVMGTVDGFSNGDYLGMAGPCGTPTRSAGSAATSSAWC